MMAPIIDQITAWLNTPQGNLLYPLVLGLSSLGALLAIWYASGSRASSERQRTQLALFFILFVQLFLLIISWLAWINLINGHMILPPLDRAISLFSLAMVVWLWAFPNPRPLMTGLVITLEAIIVMAGVFSLLWWGGQNPTMLFNTSMLAAYAFILGMALLFVGLILLPWKRPVGWGFGVVMLVIILAGHLAQYLIAQVPGDYPWLIRIGEMLAYPFLLALPRRITIESRSHTTEIGGVTTSMILTQNDEKLIKDVLDLRDERNTQAYYQKLTRLVAQLMDADVCLLMMPPKMGGQIIIPTGYNMRDDWEIDGFTVDGNKLPSLLDALKTGKTVLLEGTKPDSEVKILTNELTMGHITHLMEVPFKPQGSDTEMAILVLSKPSHPVWTELDASRLIEVLNTLLTNVAQPVARVIQAGEYTDQTKAIQRARAENEKLRNDYVVLKAEYDQLAAKFAEVMERASAPNDEQQKSLLAMVEKLEARNKELESLVGRGRPSGEEVEQLRQELKSALTDLARIPTTLSKSDQRMLELQLSAVRQLDSMGPVELVNSIAQEFRQPLSSILGYTDLLLGESVGIIGAMQRRFLERVKASAERLGMLMNELLQVLAIDGGKLDQTPNTVEIDSVIDEAVGTINAQINEKNITMRVDIPGKLPPIQINRDALQQILSNLLQNACLATPEDGEIELLTSLERKANEPNYLLISVTDQGGGIADADIPRVFLRRYKVENPLIQGVGDTGVGLAIVKSLVELLKGRIWVDTLPGVGSTFSVLLPFPENTTS